jgi:hypothetical protein
VEVREQGAVRSFHFIGDACGVEVMPQQLASLAVLVKARQRMPK